MPTAKKLHQERRFFNRRETRTVRFPEGTVQAHGGGAQLGEFVKYCLVDLRIQRNTAQSYAGAIRRFLEACDFTVAGMREYLSRIENGYTYNDYLKAFIAYSRFLGVEPPKFRFSRMEPLLDPPPTKGQLREFYEAIDVDYERLAFLGFASTGLRRSELLEVRIPQIERANRAIVPGHRSSTKRSFISFYNSEFEELLDPWLKRRPGRRSDRLFSVCGSSKSVIFMIARKKTGLHITPKVLKFWFSNEMARLGAVILIAPPILFAYLGFLINYRTAIEAVFFAFLICFYAVAMLSKVDYNSATVGQIDFEGVPSDITEALTETNSRGEYVNSAVIAILGKNSNISQSEITRALNDIGIKMTQPAVVKYLCKLEDQNIVLSVETNYTRNYRLSKKGAHALITIKQVLPQRFFWHVVRNDIRFRKLPEY